MIGLLLQLLIVLAIVGLILWGIGQLPGIPQPVKIIIYVVVGVILLLWVADHLPMPAYNGHKLL